MTPVAVYRMYDELGSLVYVGQTQDPNARFASHRIRAPWWPLVRGVDVEWHPDRNAALEVEKVAIRDEFPRFNIAHGLSTPVRQPRQSVPIAFVGAQEVAALLGLSRQRVAQLADSFPAPVAVLAMGSVWLRRDIVRWAHERGRAVRDEP